MPRVSTTLSDTEQTVTRPIVYSVIGQIMDITKIRSDAIIMFTGDSNVYSSAGSTIDSDKNKEALFSASNILHVDVTYDQNDEDINTMDAYGMYTYPIFNDRKLDVTISPIYNKIDVTISFSYRTTSKTEAIRWRNDIRMRLTQMREVNLHSIDYSYSIPLPYLVLLKEIHTLRENIAGYNETFTEYIKLHGSDAITLMSDISGNDISLTLAETQSRIVGIYDVDPIPEKPEKNSDESIWTVSFNYKFTYDKPIAASMKYPITVHNQPLPLKYVDFDEDSINLNRKNLVKDHRLNDIGYFEYDEIYNRHIPDKYYLRLPEFDDYILDQLVKGSATVFVALSGMDKDSNNIILNLNELGDVIIDKEILKFIVESEYKYIHKPWHSILNISIYRDNGLLEYESVKCDKDLNLILRTKPDLRKQYRVRFSIICDINMLSDEAIRRLRDYPKAFVKIIGSINELLATHPDFNSLGDRNYITELEFSPLYRLLTGNMNNQSGGLGGNNYYGCGLGASNLPGIYNLLKDFDPRLVADYMRNTITTRTVMVSNIMALRMDTR